MKKGRRFVVLEPFCGLLRPCGGRFAGFGVVGQNRLTAASWANGRFGWLPDTSSLLTWRAKQRLEIVLAGLKGDRTVREVCREHAIAETLYYGWRDKLFESDLTALAGKEERHGERELRQRIGQLERALDRKTYELEVAGEALRGWE